jgi:hypothetical protein
MAAMSAAVPEAAVLVSVPVAIDDDQSTPKQASLMR